MKLIHPGQQKIRPFEEVRNERHLREMYLFFRYDISDSNPVGCDGSVAGRVSCNHRLDTVVWAW